MIESKARVPWRPSPVTLVAGGVVITGFLLMGVSWWFFLLVVFGAFGPGMLREAGLLQDKDELQRRADHRAGYHAFLACGFVGGVLVAFFRATDLVVRNLEELATLFLVLLWFTWLLSSLISFWGARRAAAWILRIFGLIVLAFTVVSNLGSEWTGWTALLLHPLLSVPFFVLAWLAGRWPRISGVLSLITSGLLIMLLGIPGSGNLGLMNESVTFILFLGPLLAGGVALLFSGEN